MAAELLDVYAKRESQKGFQFQYDRESFMQFAGTFPFEETFDQKTAINAVISDMCLPKAMDRLVCGDVGFGKTEVAMRATFLAVENHKQVAVLVPTTLLAQQHYENFIQRFADYPFKIGLLSRFRTKKEQQETIEGLQKGQVDVVIGTHRVLSKDVNFLDLGLLVVDEEQRFGVKHKERLKQLKSQVDVLTLTATPIPRTLHMSMLGVRDLSVIETPPSNRYPVQTFVMEQQGITIKDGIERELARGGQVFYLYNRVETIEKKADELRQLVPEARVGVIHGQMSETTLENILYQFIEGEYDVLVTTTIIETGVDIPNANTLFIENADHMGLSQLYQLRGRVGRSNRIAYAYLMYQPDKTLTEVGEKRLPRRPAVHLFHLRGRLEYEYRADTVTGQITHPLFNGRNAAECGKFVQQQQTLVFQFVVVLRQSLPYVDIGQLTEKQVQQRTVHLHFIRRDAQIDGDRFAAQIVKVKIVAARCCLHRGIKEDRQRCGHGGQNIAAGFGIAVGKPHQQRFTVAAQAIFRVGRPKLELVTYPVLQGFAVAWGGQTVEVGHRRQVLRQAQITLLFRFNQIKQQSGKQFARFLLPKI